MKSSALPIGVVVIAIGVLVALREVFYYVDHPHRSGPSLTIAALAVAVALLGLQQILSIRNQPGA